MNTVESRTVHRVKAKDSSKTVPHTDSPDLSFQEIEERASTRTEILNAILAKEARASWRHWGLNE